MWCPVALNKETLAVDKLGLPRVFRGSARLVSHIKLNDFGNILNLKSKIIGKIITLSLSVFGTSIIKMRLKDLLNWV